MIISASRRTDIPAFFADWFFSRLREKSVWVGNPVNPHQISEVSLARDVVDGIVFWTKNSTPMLTRLHELEGYPYYFQFTLNVYGHDVEPSVPSKNDVLIPAFLALAQRAGREAAVWRYDPILLNDRYTIAYHCEYFRRMAEKLAGATTQCTISFLDDYRHIRDNMTALGAVSPPPAAREELMGRFAETARDTGLTLVTCAEEGDWSRFGVLPGRCIDPDRLARRGGTLLSVPRDTAQRPACGCAASVDIGAYNTCGNGCLYCYANHYPALIRRGICEHDPASPLLTGSLHPDDRVKARNQRSNKVL